MYCKNVPYALTGSAGIRNMQIRAFVEDDEHNIWFGTFVGLQKYDVRKQTYTLIQIPQYVGGLNHPSIFFSLHRSAGNYLDRQFLWRSELFYSRPQWICTL